jgi:hypothetical protein
VEDSFPSHPKSNFCGKKHLGRRIPLVDHAISESKSEAGHGVSWIYFLPNLGESDVLFFRCKVWKRGERPSSLRLTCLAEART